MLYILAAYPTGFRSYEVRQRLASAGLSVGADQVTALLLELQKQGLVDYPNNRWTLRGPPKPGKPVRPSPESAKPRPGSPSDLTPRPVPAAPAVPSPPVTIPCLPFTAKVTAATSDPGPAALHGKLPMGWGLLRRLLPYWREALRAEERPRIFLPLERANVEFCGLTAAGQWWPTAARAAELRLTSDPIPAPLLNHLARHAEGTDLFLGYPLQVLPGKDGDAFARPIFTFSCRLDLNAGELLVRLPAQTPDLNAEWLEKQCRDPTERRGLLRWLGIAGPTTNGDDSGDDDEDGISDGIPDLAGLTERLAAWLKKPGAEPLAPSALATSLPAAPAAVQIQNVLVLFTAGTTRYSQRTLKDLSTLTHWRDEQFAQTALAPLFLPDRLVPGMPERPPIPALPPLTLNEGQLAATRKALNAPLTVITGPPGTGKSQVVAAIMASAALTGRTALLASKNHKALDAVEERLAALLPEDTAFLARASRPWGTGKAFDLRSAAEALLARGASTGDRVQLSRAVERLARTQARLSETERQLEAQSDLADAIGATEERIEAAEGALTQAQVDWAAGAGAPILPSPPQAIDGQASLPVIGGLIQWFRAARERRALACLELLGIPWTNEDQARRLATWRHLWDTQQAQAALSSLRARLLPGTETAVLTDRLAQGYLDLMAAAAEVFKQLPQALMDMDAESRPLFAELTGALALFRGDALGQDGAAERRRVEERALPQMLRHLPLWAVTNLSAGRALPLQPGLFDYVIIDEASQCDIASAVPLLARARAAVIVGDPAQLRHVTKLTQERELHLLEANKLLASGIARWSYRSQSLFSMTAATPGVVSHLLRDHYRSAAAVVDYYNDAFYGGRLRVLTDESQLRPPPGQRPGVHWTPVAGPIVAATSGCHAPAEADAIIEHLRCLLIDQGYTGSIGIVTPFAEQAKRVTDRLTDRLPSDLIARTGLGAFTAHQFQGDARDLILLSLCLGPDTPAGSRVFLAEGGNLMNVAVSRARAVCHVFGNREAARQSGIPHLDKLVQASEPRTEDAPAIARFESPWEETLFAALKDRGIDPIPQFPLAGRRLDLAVLGPCCKLDVEVDGDRYHRDPTGRRNSRDLWRDHQIRGLGWQVRRYWVYQLREDLDACVDEIIATAFG
jgi:very-short-patch-repair endonuclease